MIKLVNLLGIRKKVILSRTKYMGNISCVVMRGITKEQEENIDKNKAISFGNTVIGENEIYCYGQLDINNKEDVKYLKQFNLIDLDAENFVHSNYDYDKGTVEINTDRISVYPTWNIVNWFKYNHLLIGKPKRIIIYKCKKSEL